MIDDLFYLISDIYAWLPTLLFFSFLFIKFFLNFSKILIKYFQLKKDEF